MSYISKYAVPFNTRSASTSSNVVSKVIQGGTGYLNIELPVNPSYDACIGFKVKVTSEDGKLLFEGHISGSSSDGYSWVHVSSTSVDESEDYVVSGKPTLFCYRYIDPNNGNKAGNVIKSMLIGDSSTNWGSIIIVSIEILQATLTTSPDGESDVSSTLGNEYTALSESTDESDPKVTWTDGWNFSVSNLVNGTVAMSVDPQLPKGLTSSLIVEGVVEGKAVENEDGSVIIRTAFNGGSVNLHDPDSDTYGYIVADGRYLTNLNLNESINNMTFDSNGLKEAITVRSTSDSDVNLSFSIKNGGELVTPMVTVNSANFGSWDEYNRKRLLFKMSSVTGDSSPSKSIPLIPGEVGVIVNGLNTDLYIGTGSENKLVGAAKICTEEELPLLDKVKGRIAVVDGVVKVCDEDWTPVKFDSELISIDEVKDGYFYHRTNADAVLGGEVVRLKWDGGLLLSNDIQSHMTDDSIHISELDRAKWDNKLDSDFTYSKSDIDDKISSVSDNYRHSYHSPINSIVDGNTDLTTHDYPYGHRVLVTETGSTKPVIKVAGLPNQWLEDEEFKLGDKVTEAFGSYREYLNRDNKVVISNDNTSRGIEVFKRDRDPVTDDLEAMKIGDWFINEGGYLYD